MNKRNENIRNKEASSSNSSPGSGNNTSSKGNTVVTLKRCRQKAVSHRTWNPSILLTSQSNSNTSSSSHSSPSSTCIPCKTGSFLPSVPLPSHLDFLSACETSVLFSVVRLSVFPTQLELELPVEFKLVEFFCVTKWDNPCLILLT